MPDYTFNTLNDKDFEVLVRDLLQAELGVHLESFKSGKDQGIDLRYTSNTAAVGTTIIQAKHWSKSGFAPLLRELGTKELPKIKKLAPDRYIVATSVPLSAKNKGDIVAALTPYVKNTSDIFGLDELNGLLEKYPKVEKGHYKLWISSTAVLERILHNAVTGRSNFVREQIERKARLFVPTSSFSKALEILNRRQVLLIKGVPGVGKTTLAEFILYSLLDKDFELVAIEDDLRDAEEVIEPDKRQAFYFDDFLGSNYLELVSTKSSGSKISKFVDRIQSDKQKRLILTTRTTILNKALHQFHQIGAPNLANSEYEVDIDDYSRIDKAKILYNHLYFSDVEPDYFSPIFENKSYLKVIDHKNYNPRIIEFITDRSRLVDVASEDYLEFVQSNLDTPNDIWEVAYDRQIDEEARLLLQTIFSIGSVVPHEVLRDAFEARLDYEVETCGLKRSGNPFYGSVKLLLDGFIVHQRRHGSDGDYSFINPSLIDYFVGYFSRDAKEKWRVLDSAIFVEQVSERFGVNSNSPVALGEGDERARYLSLIVSRASELRSAKGATVELQIVSLLLASFEWEDIGKNVESLLNAADLGGMSDSDYYEAVYIIELLADIPSASECLRARWTDFILPLVQLADERHQLSGIRELFDKCAISYDEWLQIGSHESIMQAALDEFWEYELDNAIDESGELKDAFNEETFDDAKYALERELIEFNDSFGLVRSPSFHRVEWIDLQSTLSDNAKRAEAEDHQADAWREERSLTEHSENAAINNLFSK